MYCLLIYNLVNVEKFKKEINWCLVFYYFIVNVEKSMAKISNRISLGSCFCHLVLKLEIHMWFLNHTILTIVIVLSFVIIITFYGRTLCLSFGWYFSVSLRIYCFEEKTKDLNLGLLPVSVFYWTGLLMVYWPVYWLKFSGVTKKCWLLPVSAGPWSDWCHG